MIRPIGGGEKGPPRRRVEPVEPIKEYKKPERKRYPKDSEDQLPNKDNRGIVV